MKILGHIEPKENTLLVRSTGMSWVFPAGLERDFHSISSDDLLAKINVTRNLICRERDLFNELTQYITLGRSSSFYINFSIYQMSYANDDVTGFGDAIYARRTISIPWYNCDVSDVGASLNTDVTTHDALISVNFIRDNELTNPNWRDPIVLGDFIRRYDERHYKCREFGDTKEHAMTSVNYINDECIIFHCKKCHKLSWMDKCVWRVDRIIEPQAVGLCLVCAAEERRNEAR